MELDPQRPLSVPEHGAITVLHVDDDPQQTDLARTHIESEHDDVSVHTEHSADAALDHLADAAVDCVVSDYQMPGMDGLDLLAAVREDWPRLPFILFTGRGSEDIASEAISAGVTDYLQKRGSLDQYTILVNRIRNAVSQCRAVREYEAMHQAVEHSGHSIYRTDTEGRITYVNPAFEEITGYDRAAAIGETPAILNSGVHDDEFFADLWGTILDGEVWRSRIVNERADGTKYVADQTIAPVMTDGEIREFVAVNAVVGSTTGGPTATGTGDPQHLQSPTD